jgi:hypothetical protein
VTPQPDEFQHPFKSSWFLEQAKPEALRELRRQLTESGLAVKVVYSSARDLDVLPQHATKGGALGWLCARLGIPLTQVLVAGDTENDTSMFRLPGVRGIVVENALPELYETTVDLPLLQDDVLGALWCDALEGLGLDPAAGVPLEGGSTDMGNVSQAVPALHPWFRVPGLTASLHSADYAAAAGTDAAYAEWGEAAATALREAGATHVVVAGKPADWAAMMKMPMMDMPTMKMPVAPKMMAPPMAKPKAKMAMKY